MHLSKLFSLATIGALVFAGCSKKSGPELTADGLTKIRVGYIGITCEAPIFSAVENGFFKEEGLEPELVKCEWSKYKDVLALGGYDITHHLIMYFLKPIEQGLDVKFTGGIHRGCLRVQGPVEGGPQYGGGFAREADRRAGHGDAAVHFCHARAGREWDRCEEGDRPGGSFRPASSASRWKRARWMRSPIRSRSARCSSRRGACATSRTRRADAPYKDEYCCAVIVNGKYLSNNPKATAAATRALLKGAKWVEANPAAAARLSVEKKYLASNPELNTVAISHLRYVPSVSGAEAAVNSAAEEMKTAGMLSPTTDVPALAKKALAHAGRGDRRVAGEAAGGAPGRWPDAGGYQYATGGGA